MGSRDAAIDAVCLRMAIDTNVTRAATTQLAAGVVAFLVGTEETAWRLAAWFGVVGAINLVRLGLALWLRRAPRTDEQVRAVEALHTTTMVLAASCWGALLAVLGFPTDLRTVTIVLLTIGGMMTAGVHSTSVTLKTMNASIALSMAPPFLHMVLSGDTTLRVLSVLIGAHVATMLGAARGTNRETRASIALRFENDELLRDLRLEKERELAARQDAERANREKSRFVAAASHDARQPLHALGLLVDTLKAQPLEPKAAQLLSSIDLAHASLVSLHEGLLELSVTEVGQVTARPVEVPLSTLLHALEAECAPRAKHKGLRLDVRRAGELAVRTDPALLLRVVRNLAFNAITYTSKGRVLVTARRRGADCLLQVWDTGVGIAPEHLPRIFDELYQVGNAARERTQGLGLGLAIVKRLAAALGTEVTVRSTPGRGSVFSLRLPLVSAPRPLPARQSSGAVALVVDDDAQARQALSSMLEQWGFEVVAAGDAEEARGYADELERLELVVSDLWLPGASGLELLHSLEGKAGLKRVLMSGDTTAESDAMVRASGLTFVRKPVRAQALAGALELASVAPAAPAPG